jgi:hypothetical protein
MALALAVVSAGAQAQTAGQAAAPLRGYQVPDQPQPAPQPAPLPAPAPAAPGVDAAVGPPPLADLSPVPRFQDDPAPRFSYDAAPRVEGLDRGGGGAACRTACAETRYMCRANEPLDVCDETWSQCVVGCPESSTSPP